MKETKSIGIIIRSLKTGGAEKQSVLLAHLLSEHYHVFLFLQHPEIAPQHLKIIENSNIHLVQLKGNFIGKSIQLNQLIRQNQISHLFAYLSSDNVLASLVKIRNKNCQVYGGIRSSKLPIHKLLVLKLLHNTLQNATIFNNHVGRKAFLQKGFKKQKSIVIPNCTDFTGIPHKEINTNGTINIISVGRFVNAKDYPTAINAIYQLINKGLKINYQIIGFGELEKAIKSWIKQKKLDQHIQIIISPSNIHDYYQKADIYLCSSDFEGLSNAIMEALSYHLPIVATNVGDNPELVEHNKNGFLTPKNNPNAIAEALELLCHDKNMRKEFGGYGHQLLMKNFSKEKFLDRYISLIENT